MEERFRRVRKHLDSLGYMQVLIPESLPLVEKLTADLIQTTESLKKYKELAKETIEERDTLQYGVEPYRCDNAKLVKECNDLHLAFLQFREQNEKLQKDLKRRILCFERDGLEIGAECEKLKKRIRDLEYESAKKTDHLLSLNKNSGSKSSTNAFATSSKSKLTFKSDTDMALADQKILKLTKEIGKLKDEISHLYEINESHKSQIFNRDKEIERLTQMLEGGRPMAAVYKDYCPKESEGLVTQLQKQASFLQKEKAELEVRLKEALGKQHEAMKRALSLADRNKHLEDELRDIDQMALTVEADCNMAVKSTTEKVSRLEDKVHELRLQIQSLEKELSEMKRDKQELLSDIDAIKVEKKHLQSVLETALDEKKRLSDRLNQLTIIEHDLNLEIDRLVQASANQKRKIAELECQLLSGKIETVSDLPTKRDSSSEQLKTERDFYIREYRRLTNQINDPSTKYNRASQLLTCRSNSKDQLIATLQHENKILAQEKHNLMTRLENARETVEGADFEGLSWKTAMRKVERERDMLKADLCRLEEERDALRQRLKATMESQLTDRSKFERELSDADNEIRRLEMDRHDLIQTQGSRRGTISNLEEQCITLKEQLRIAQTDLNQQKALYVQLKTLQEQTDTALADSQGQIGQLEEELIKAKDHIHVLENQRNPNEAELLQKDISVLKQKLTQIDKEKDDLLISLDDKTEKIAMLEQELRVKDSNIDIAEGTVMDLKKKMHKTIDDSSAREQLLKTSSLEMASLKQDLEMITRTKENLMAENRQLQDDLASVTVQYRTAQTQIDDCKRHIDDLKKQLQTYVAEVRRFEDLMDHKESERNDLLEQFRSLSQEANLLETNNHSLEHEATQSKVQLSVTLDHVSDLEEKLTHQDNQITDYERKISDLRSQLLRMEEQVNHYRDQQYQTAGEVVTLRELCTRLDQQKDKLIRELQEKDEQKVKINEDVLRLRRESETLHSTLTRDRTSLDNLEKLLAESRDEALRQKVTNEELEFEIKALKQKLNDCEAKLSTTPARAVKLFRKDVCRVARMVDILGGKHEFFGVLETESDTYPTNQYNRSSCCQVIYEVWLSIQGSLPRYKQFGYPNIDTPGIPILIGNVPLYKWDINEITTKVRSSMYEPPTCIETDALPPDDEVEKILNAEEELDNETVWNIRRQLAGDALRTNEHKR
ncbi:hypothetical protein PPYR_07110 [Photinus pyralis]|uniref:Uncharacterized protein n=1 Tax=Photinus pyralis TaxID=7054 RepID=A0A5N4APH0_PHOPY|nr:centrosomal protein of 135 kDa isoform X3 [Photinus pyralis]KAB0799230.1 hypothetical protein PPYR_07110 [Photinus pyralis]